MALIHAMVPMPWYWLDMIFHGWCPVIIIIIQDNDNTKAYEDKDEEKLMESVKVVVVLSKMSKQIIYPSLGHFWHGATYVRTILGMDLCSS